MVAVVQITGRLEKSAEPQKNSGGARDRDKSWYPGSSHPRASTIHENWSPVVWLPIYYGSFTSQTIRK